MLIVHVFITVKPDQVEDFITETKLNAQASVLEPGIARFDFLQSQDDPNRFLLVEVYRSQEDTSQHKVTDHYKRWQHAVENMMALPRSKQIYQNIYPDENGWD